MVQTFRFQKLALAVMTAGLASSLACSNAGKSDSDGSVGGSVSSGPALGADVTKPSRILITPKAQWSEIKGYIVGRADSSALTQVPDQVGKIGFQNLTSGLYDIVIEANEKGVDGKIAPVALKISGINLNDSADAQIRDIELKPYVKLEGRVVLDEAEGSTDAHGGITVSIPGTLLKTVSAADGSFQFSGVPEGSHSIEMSKEGYHAGFIFGRTYRASEVLATVALVKDSHRLETGVHYLGAPLAAGSAQRISVHLRAPSPMNYFRYATGQESIESRPWILSQSSLELDLPPGDKPEIRVQYSLDQRQLSPVFRVNIPTE